MKKSKKDETQKKSKPKEKGAKKNISDPKDLEKMQDKKEKPESKWL